MRSLPTDPAMPVLSDNEELGDIKGVRIFGRRRTVSSKGKADDAGIAFDEKRKSAIVLGPI
jgi:hypothetical protein